MFRNGNRVLADKFYQFDHSYKEDGGWLLKFSNHLFLKAVRSVVFTTPVINRLAGITTTAKVEPPIQSHFI